MAFTVSSSARQSLKIFRFDRQLLSPGEKEIANLHVPEYRETNTTRCRNPGRHVGQPHADCMQCLRHHHAPGLTGNAEMVLQILFQFRLAERAFRRRAVVPGSKMGLNCDRKLTVFHERI